LPPISYHPSFLSYLPIFVSFFLRQFKAAPYGPKLLQQKTINNA
jgi:hypothetical protein